MQDHLNRLIRPHSLVFEHHFFAVFHAPSMFAASIELPKSWAGLGMSGKKMFTSPQRNATNVWELSAHLALEALEVHEPIQPANINRMM